MSTIDLSQAEADALFTMKKIKTKDKQYIYPIQGGSLRIPLTSENNRESFLLDITRGRIELSRVTLQNRSRQVIILTRLDFGGAPHRNPDGAEIKCPHLHLYKEGFGDKWAIPIPNAFFKHCDDQWQTLQDFMDFCNITEKPSIIRELL